MKKISARQLTTAAAIAALYTVLSLASSFIPTVGGVFQFRVSEALTILPYFTPAAIPGLFIGCLLSNLITGALPYDLVFGSLATLIGAIGTFALRKLGKKKPLPYSAGRHAPWCMACSAAADCSKHDHHAVCYRKNI